MASVRLDNVEVIDLPILSNVLFVDESRAVLLVLVTLSIILFLTLLSIFLTLSIILFLTLSILSILSISLTLLLSPANAEVIGLLTLLIVLVLLLSV